MIELSCRVGSNWKRIKIEFVLPKISYVQAFSYNFKAVYENPFT